MGYSALAACMYTAVELKQGCVSVITFLMNLCTKGFFFFALYKKPSGFRFLPMSNHISWQKKKNLISLQ